MPKKGATQRGKGGASSVLRGVAHARQPFIEKGVCIPFLKGIARYQGNPGWLVSKLSRDRVCEDVLSRLGLGADDNLFTASLLAALRQLVGITRPELATDRDKILAAIARHEKVRETMYRVLCRQQFYVKPSMPRRARASDVALACKALDAAVAFWLSQSNAQYPELPRDVLALPDQHWVHGISSLEALRKLCKRIRPTPSAGLSEANVPFRELAIIPSLNVLHTERAELYMPPFDPNFLLEAQFRLLREDHISLLRDPAAFADPRYPRVFNVQPKSFDTFNGRAIAFSFEVGQDTGYQHLDDDARLRFWARSRLLRPNWLVVLLAGSTPRYFARVEHSCSIQDLVQGQVPLVMLNDGDNQAMIDAVCQQTAFPDEPPVSFTLVQMSPIFAFEPVLRRLQQMERIPRVLAAVLAGRKRRRGGGGGRARITAGVPAPGHTPVAAAQGSSGDQGARMHQGRGGRSDALADTDASVDAFLDTHSLNPSQREAVKHALVPPCALIQGPPGTGKTHIGVVLSDYIVKDRKQKMLVCCYTNHALDQFLEELLERERRGRRSGSESSKPKIVRLGGGCRRSSVQPYTLDASRDKAEAETTWQRQDRDQLLHRRKWLAREVEKLQKELETRLQADERSSTAVLWFLLRHGTIEERIAFDLPKPPQEEFEEAWRRWCMGKDVSTMPFAAEKDRKAFLERLNTRKAYLERLNARQQASGQKVPASPKLYEDPDAHAAALRFFFKFGTSRERRAIGDSVDDQRWATLWRQWCADDDPLRQQSPASTFWPKTKQERLGLVEAWNRRRKERYSNDIVHLLKRIRRIEDDLLLKMRAQDRAILEQADIVACTTTGAAMHQDLLMQLDIPVFLAEEAGEILEAHILTSLPENCKHVILIGDHKQLRPKVQNYEFQKESRKGYDLNVSLFERLALTLKLPVLKVQHRMHPEISRFVREQTYPELVDANRTLVRDTIVGLHHRVLFLDHNERENLNDKGKTTRQNTFEARMVHQVVQHLLLQGYLSRDIAVITPYSGQARLLDAQLRRIVTQTNEQLHLGCVCCSRAHEWRDEVQNQRDLERRQLILKQSTGEKRASVHYAGVPDASALRGKASVDTGTRDAAARTADAAVSDAAARTYPIRVRTVDNFQGEEAKIIVISLVRSNDDGEIGFLREPERVNVLLSRARDCMIMIGDKSTLHNARSGKGRRLWTKVFQLLREANAINTAFPVFCPRHPDRCIGLVPSTEATDRVEPWNDGGCDELCGTRLACGHTCPLRCHGVDTAVQHDTFLCKHRAFVLCGSGHVVSTHCHVVAAQTFRDRAQFDLVCTPCVLLKEMDHLRNCFGRDVKELDCSRERGERQRSLLEQQLDVLRSPQREADNCVRGELQAIKLDTQRTRVLRSMLRLLLAKKKVHVYQQLAAYGERLEAEMEERKAELLAERDDEDGNASNDSEEEEQWDSEGERETETSNGTDDDDDEDVDEDDKVGSESEEADEDSLPPDDPRTRIRLRLLARACSGSDDDSVDTDDAEEDEEEDEEVEGEEGVVEEEGEVMEEEEHDDTAHSTFADPDEPDEPERSRALDGEAPGARGIQEADEEVAAPRPSNNAGGATERQSTHNIQDAVADTGTDSDPGGGVDASSPDSGVGRNSASNGVADALQSSTAWELWARRDYEQLMKAQKNAADQLSAWREGLEKARSQLHQRRQDFERALRFLGKYMLDEPHQGTKQFRLCQDHSSHEARGGRSTANNRVPNPPFKVQLLQTLRQYADAFSAVAITGDPGKFSIMQDCAHCKRPCCPYCLRHGWSSGQRDGFTRDTAGHHGVSRATCDGSSCDRLWRLLLQQPLIDVGLCQAREALAALREAECIQQEPEASVGEILKCEAEQNKYLKRLLESQKPISRCIKFAQDKIKAEAHLQRRSLRARVAMARALQLQLLVRVMLRDKQQDTQDKGRRYLNEHMPHLHVWCGPVADYDAMTRAAAGAMVQAPSLQEVKDAQAVLENMTPRIGARDVDPGPSMVRMQPQQRHQDQVPFLVEEDAKDSFELERQREFDVARRETFAEDYDSDWQSDTEVDAASAEGIGMEDGTEDSGDDGEEEEEADELEDDEMFAKLAANYRR